MAKTKVKKKSSTKAELKKAEAKLKKARAKVKKLKKRRSKK